MGFEFIAVMGASIGIIGGIFTSRLKFINEQYEKILNKINAQIDVPNERLEDELKKKKPDKSLVISLVSQLVASKRLESEIEEQSNANSGKQIYLDFTAIGTLGLTAVFSVLDNTYQDYLVLIGMISFLPVSLSVITFLGQIGSIQNFKKKTRVNSN